MATPGGIRTPGQVAERPRRAVRNQEGVLLDGSAVVAISGTVVSLVIDG